MSDALSGLVGLALIFGLFVAYGMQRRARKGPSTVAAVNSARVVEQSAISEADGQSSSPNWAMPIVYCLLLVGADSYRGGFWGYLWQVVFYRTFWFHSSVGRSS